MPRRRAVLILCTLLSWVAAVLLLPQAAHAEQQVPIDLRGNSSCDRASGTWNVQYAISNFAPVAVVIDSVTDPATGEVLTPNTTTVDSYGYAYVFRVLPGPTAQTAVSVLLHRLGRATDTRMDLVLPLPSGCVPVAPGGPCVNLTAARYRHTFDAATGTVTIRMVSAPLCPGITESVMLVSRTDEQTTFRDSYVDNGAMFSSTNTALTLHVPLPACHAHVLAYFDVPYAHAVDDPTLMLGASSAPGNRSSGPKADAWIAGPTCHSYAFASATGNCDGSITFRLRNMPKANVSTELKFEEHYGSVWNLYREVALEPGEVAMIRLVPQHPGGTQIIFWHGDAILQTVYSRPRWCDLRVVPPHTGSPWPIGSRLGPVPPPRSPTPTATP